MYSSGNRTFEPVLTLAAQARCSNITHLLQKSCHEQVMMEGDAKSRCTMSLGKAEISELALEFYH